MLQLYRDVRKTQIKFFNCVQIFFYFSNFNELSTGKDWKSFLKNFELVKGFILSMNMKEVPRFNEFYSDLVLNGPEKKTVKFNDTLKKMLETKVFVDITLETKDKKKIVAHKAVLASKLGPTLIWCLSKF